MKKSLFLSPITCTSIAIIVASLVPTSCKLNKSRLNGAITNRGQISPGAAVSDILVQDSVHFTRADTFASGTLTFSTKLKVKCAINYWTKNSQNHPQVKPCQQDAGATQFSESIAPIATNENLSIKLYFWPMEQSKNEDLYYRIDENADFSAVSFQHLVTGKINLPLKSMEVYELSLDAPKKLADLSAMLTMSPGCSGNKAVLPNPFVQPNKTLTINNLSTTGFATGPATVDTQDPKRLSIYFDLLQMNQDWNWNFKYGDADHQLVTKAPGYLNSLKIIGAGTEFIINNKNLSLIDNGITLTGTEKEFDWTGQNVSDGAILFIQYTGLQTGAILTCVFPASANKGTIPDDLANNLPADVYNFIAIMQSSQIVTPTDGSPTWILTAQDWRFSKVAWKTTL